MGAPNWSDQELDRLRSYFPAIGPTGAAAKIGRSIHGVVSKAQELGLKYTVQRDNRDLYPDVPWQLRIDGRNQREGVIG